MELTEVELTEAELMLVVEGLHAALHNLDMVLTQNAYYGTPSDALARRRGDCKRLLVNMQDRLCSLRDQCLGRDMTREVRRG